jgi:hypothetical protein
LLQIHELPAELELHKQPVAADELAAFHITLIPIIMFSEYVQRQQN